MTQADQGTGRLEHADSQLMWHSLPSRRPRHNSSRMGLARWCLDAHKAQAFVPPSRYGYVGFGNVF